MTDNLLNRLWPNDKKAILKLIKHGYEIEENDNDYLFDLHTAFCRVCLTRNRQFFFETLDESFYVAFPSEASPEAIAAFAVEQDKIHALYRSELEND